ncbi:hypothetical protein AAMO2058_000515500 [Amorphochlora amoebiformis]
MLRLATFSFLARRQGCIARLSTFRVAPRWLLIYDYVEDVLEKRGPHREAHIGLIGKHIQDGSALMAGACANPPDKAYFVFTSEEKAKEFSQDDPYVKNGIVTAVAVREWNCVEFD